MPVTHSVICIAALTLTWSCGSPSSLDAGFVDSGSTSDAGSTTDAGGGAVPLAGFGVITCCPSLMRGRSSPASSVTFS